ncbi:MAG: hypothetical protein A2122_02345 [Candidatus Liptonbacteria bacterium GWB1_49_6]|uniref:Uncharacterized protein n=1 Tax=Candidatus Liptonbacteria bacterium GWB1_49_6 TaxID=1798644 RepID=A0A1G2C6N7_9BACT|nr:MAG: hypothetical protein A2122_02345 [Candidatus Liptonbacteria bacterium GWB1_49_6]
MGIIFYWVADHHPNLYIFFNTINLITFYHIEFLIFKKTVDNLLRYPSRGNRARSIPAIDRLCRSKIQALARTKLEFSPRPACPPAAGKPVGRASPKIGSLRSK